MKLADIDYYAIYGKSWLNRLPAVVKLFSILVILVIAISYFDYRILGILYCSLLFIILISNVQKLKIILLSLYPLVFMFFYLISIENLTIAFAATLIFRVLSISTSFVILVFTTPYTKIFAVLQRFLPAFLVNILFLTYRSIFILGKTLENLMLAIHLRGKLKFSKPVETFKIISSLIGYLIIRAMESSENMYNSLRLRGYSSNIKYVRK